MLESWKLGHFAFHWALLSHFHIVHLSFQSIFHPFRCTPQFCLKLTSCISNFTMSPCDFVQLAQWHLKQQVKVDFFNVVIIILKLSKILLYNDHKSTKFRGSKVFPCVQHWDYLLHRMLFTVCPSLYNICCLRTYLLNLSCHSAECASPWMAVFSISERSTLTLSDRWILITVGLWHPFSTLGELIRLSFPVIFCRLRQRGIVLFLKLLLCCRHPGLGDVWSQNTSRNFQEFGSDVVACK